MVVSLQLASFISSLALGLHFKTRGVLAGWPGVFLCLQKQRRCGELATTPTTFSLSTAGPGSSTCSTRRVFSSARADSHNLPLREEWLRPPHTPPLYFLPHACGFPSVALASSPSIRRVLISIPPVITLLYQSCQFSLLSRRSFFYFSRLFKFAPQPTAGLPIRTSPVKGG